MRLILASGSPRRSQILETLGLEFTVMPADVDETRHPEEPPDEYVVRVAAAKANAVAEPGAVVIGCDTAVVHEGRVMGKPGHPQEARAMLRTLQGTVHEVFTGMAVTGWDEGPVTHATLDVSAVEFLPLTDDEIRDYVDTGEPMDKAGSYALQGLGGLFVKRVDGSPFTVIGLPIHLLPRMLAAAGAGLASFKAPDNH